MKNERLPLSQCCSSKQFYTRAAGPRLCETTAKQSFFYASFQGKELVLECFDAGASDVFHKPFSGAEFSVRRVWLFAHCMAAVSGILSVDRDGDRRMDA